MVGTAQMSCAIFNVMRSVLKNVMNRSISRFNASNV